MANTQFRSMFLNQRTFDSASPVGSAVVVHRFETEGEYDIDVGADGETPDRVTLSVGPTVSDRAAAVTIDTARSSPGKVAALRRSKLDAGGYAAFTTATAAGQDSVIVARRAGSRDAEFDSRRLGAGDLFAVTLVRPGQYVVRNVIGKAEGRIIVTYPVVGDRPYRPADPVHVQCTPDGFEPEQLEIGPAQGVIFHIDTDARVVVELVDPDKGPRPGPRGHWTAPTGRRESAE